MPADLPLLIKQRVEFRRDFRFASGNAFVDLTGYEAYASIWNTDRSVKYLDFTLVWLNRVIVNTALTGDYHIRLSLPEVDTIRTDEDAMWDLRLEPPVPTQELPFYPVEGKVTFAFSFSDDA